MNGRRLVADIGGSNVRLGIADRAGHLTEVKSYRVADFRSFAEALLCYLESGGATLDVEDCAVAAAGPVDGNRVKITNNNWSIDRAELNARMKGIPVALVNDLEAVASALPHLTLDDFAPIGRPAPIRPEHRTMLALNIGTGFGAASVLLREGRWWTVPSEAGHMRLGAFAPEGPSVRPAGGTIESVLSGRGITELYAGLSDSDAAGAVPVRDAGAIFDRVACDADAMRTLQSVTQILGRVAGDLTLATAAWGGVYFCGSVACAWAALADAEQFRIEFAGQGPMRARLDGVPTSVIRRDNVALFGLAMLQTIA